MRFKKYFNLIVLNFRDLSLDLLLNIFIVFILFTKHVNKPDIFELIIYQ